MTLLRPLALGLIAGLALGSISGCNVEPCTPQSCSGCCDDRGICQSGNEPAACGLAGSACINCGADVCNPNGTCFGTYLPAPNDAGLDDLLPDANFVDAGVVEEDAGVDAGEVDAGEVDAGEVDAGGVDAGELDAGEVDAGAPDAGEDAGVDAGVDAGFDAGIDAGPAGFYVSPLGNDANAGTRGAPFLTLTRAASLAQPGDLIIALDGLYDSTTQPAFSRFNGTGVRVPDGVSVVAETPGSVTFRGDQGMGFDFLGSGALAGVSLGNFSIAVRFQRGVGAIQAVDFAGCGSGGGGAQSCVEVRGDAGVTMLPGFRADYFFAPGNALAGTYEEGQLTLRGGRLTQSLNSGVSGNSALRATGNSRLIVEDFTLGNTTTPIGFAANGTARLDLTRVRTFDGGTTTWAVGAYANSTVTIEDSTLAGYGIGVCVPPNTGSSPRVVLRDTLVTADSTGVYAGYFTSPRVELYDSRIVDAGQYGIQLAGDYPASTLLVHRSEVSGSLYQGISLTNGATPYRFELRDSVVTRSGQMGLMLGGSTAAVFDLGTASDAGNNVLRDNAASGAVGQANLRFVSGTGGVVRAHGNWWQPNVQGADDEGRYGADGGVVTFTGPRAGGNVYMDSAGTTVHLAE